MLDCRPHLFPTDFPPIQRKKLTWLQVNLGYLCNQQCVHCHVNAGPNRTELMSRETVDQVIAFMQKQPIELLDLTGGAPEMNEHFQYLVEQAANLGVKVLDRCNLTILMESEYQHLAEFLAKHQVQIVASLPCYLESNVDAQRGKGVFEKSIAALQKLNELGYGQPDSDLELNLVFNPQGPDLPPSQTALQQDYEKYLWDKYQIRFNQLLTIANMPINRFGSFLLSKGEFDNYLTLLKDNMSLANLDGVMCRSLISVDWQGHVYDCDFNQQLDLSIPGRSEKTHISDLMEHDFLHDAIAIGEHCYGCTAGQGSGCGGALD